MDDASVDRLHNMLLIDPLEKFTIKELDKWVGPNAKQYDRTRAILTATLMKQYSESLKQRERTKPLLIKEGRVILNDCSVHSFDYAEQRLEAKGEMDWHQHDQWACAFGQLSDRFEVAKAHIVSIGKEISNWSHSDECDASNCHNEDCDCPFKPELLDADGEISDEHDYGYADKDHTDCTCSLQKLQDMVDTAMAQLGASYEETP